MTTASPIQAGVGSSFQLAAQSVKPQSTDEAGFSKVIHNFLNDVNTQQVNMDTAIEQMFTGEVDNLHDVMLTISKADLSFRLFMEVRNKAIDAYREVMRMQL